MLCLGDSGTQEDKVKGDYIPWLQEAGPQSQEALRIMGLGPF